MRLDSKNRTRTKQARIFAVAVLASILAGCTGDPPALQTVEPTPDVVDVCGVVVGPDIRPLSDARVSLDGRHNTSTDGTGTFCFQGVENRTHLLLVQAPGHLDASRQWTPEHEDMKIVLEPVPSKQPYQTTLEFKGFMQCAMEALIISGSCDTLAHYTNDAVEPHAGQRPLPEPIPEQNVFLFEIQPGWQTMVFDVTFDEAPGLDGLRTVLRGAFDAGEGLAYDQYGRWHDATSYTFHVVPNGTYTGGDEPVPAHATTFQAEMLPHSHGYYATCDAGACFLGAAAAMDVAFEIVVTAFYVEPAPEDWTARA